MRHGLDKSGSQVGISARDVHLGSLDLGMPHQLSQALHWHLVLGQPMGEGVSQLMASQLHAGCLTVLFETVLDACHAQRPSVLVQEEVIVLAARTLL